MVNTVEATTRNRAARGRPRPSPGAATGLSRRGTFLLRVVIAVAFLGVWELAGASSDVAFWISSPSSVVVQIGSWYTHGVLWSGIGTTLLAAVYGFVLGGLGGAVVGFLLGWSRRAGAVLEPFALALYSIPKIALGPLFIMGFGIGIQSKVALAALAVFFLVFFTTFQGVREVDSELISICRVFGASRIQTMVKIGLPQAAVWVFTGLRMALPHAVIATIVGEFLASTKGVGFLINTASSNLNSAGVFAGVVILVAMSVLLGLLLRLLERRVFRWKETT